MTIIEDVLKRPVEMDAEERAEIEKWEANMDPLLRAGIREMYSRIHSMPPDKREAVRDHLRNMFDFDPSQGLPSVYKGCKINILHGDFTITVDDDGATTH